ncbi:CPBP family intramembrane glutamic endopeptidase [Bacillus cytotoxicus]|uniref:CPBP family intramembrane glutamic endopeptidase n=1 Tax=Bacillus cytotoxicus TaxID=580165 RepID=UPI003D6606A8
MNKFTKLVAAEDFSENVWTKKDYITLLLIPLIFLAGFITEYFSVKNQLWAIIDTSLRIIMFLFLMVVYAPMLRIHWSKFKLAWKRSVLLIIVGGVLLQILISLIRSLIPGTSTSTRTDVPPLIDPLTASPEMFMLLIYIALGPIVTGLIEDTVFRYTLLGKILQGGFFRKACIIIGNSILFGLIHYYNFGSVMDTIPFMFAGLFLNIIYLWTRNIWHVLLIHTVNNTVLTIGALLIIVIVRLLGLKA